MTTYQDKTAVYGIIGDPIKHSLSPLFQNYFITTHQLDATYDTFHVLPENLESDLAQLHAKHVLGLNVTVPHKESILNMKSGLNIEADEDAKIIGAVNTLKRTPHGWRATNTDWQGFAATLQGLNADVTNSPVLIFGAGGTTRAVVHALAKQGAKEIWICNRSPERCEKFIQHAHQSYPSVKINALAWQDTKVQEKSSVCKVLINTTSIGLNENDIFPFVLQGSGVAIDVVYKPTGKTAFADAAQQAGFLAVDGLPMLIAQGIVSFAFWHDIKSINNHNNLPDRLESLQWVEHQLSRKPLNLLGWGK